jgi:hypothetical protein
MTASLADFVTRWRASGAEERANKDLFFAELCDVLDVPRPNPKTGDPARDTYVFEADVRVPHEGGATTVKKIDVYRAGAFILEAKQGQDAGESELAKKLNKAKRGTPAWEEAMNGARGQALGYARMMDRPPPFLVVADLGHCFDLYASFDGTDHYTPFPNARASRVFFGDLATHADLLRAVLTDPLALDPSRQSAKVTREVAEHLAALAQSLEKAKHAPETVATFLMRCLFTMFAEDVGLLPEYPATKQGLFTGALEHLWKPNPKAFPGGIEGLWRAMNAGTDFGFVGKLLRFNGGLFKEPAALPLTAEQLDLLLDAAKCNWSEVEPAIFGTLLERALDEKERHALGAHYTPRAYVERLVRPTIEEPLRADWDLVQAEVRQLVEQAEDAKTAKARKAKLDDARAKARAFHQKLCATKVLDPACGSGNFLYVALDLFQRLEGEVLAKLEGLGETQQLLRADSIRVTPAQFLGIEKKRWAKEIAELVLWIGYLQHHVRAYGKATPPPEPVLQDYKNIECRDAVLAWDSEELVRDEKGKPVTRWDGVTMKTHPVTGAEVPDETATVPVVRYVNPRKAEWPKADFVVGNPPFMGVNRMRVLLGDEYSAALRASWPDVADGVDYVMYWWRAASVLAGGAALRRFGFITTNSITQATNRRVVQDAVDAKSGVGICFAVPDHPWVDEASGADVRIAMTVASAEAQSGTLWQFSPVPGEPALSPVRVVSGRINSNLTIGADVTAVSALAANRGLCAAGVNPWGTGFVVPREQAIKLGLGVVAGIERHLRRYMNGRDLVQQTRDTFIIDAYGLSVDELRDRYPSLFQHVELNVKPERDLNKNADARKNWWLFTGTRRELRAAIDGLQRFISTSQTAKHRVFMFVEADVLPGVKLVNVASDDAGFLGVLSSRVHVLWAAATGGRIGVGNDLVYNSTLCFDPFAFPVCTPAQAARIRSLGEDLDAHRKHQQAAHPGLTITGMYNVLEKLRSGEALTAKEKVIHEEGLVSVLKQIHDDLDAAVFDAYGWPTDLTDEQLLEKLVALNAERAEEEKNGLVRWLRPDFQNPSGVKAATQAELPAADEDGAAEPADTNANSTASASERASVAWPKSLPDQIAAIRDLVLRGGSAWTAAQASKCFNGVGAKGVAPVLDSLAALGLVVAYEQGGERRWRAARAG